VILQSKELAAEALEAAAADIAFSDGRLRIAGTDRSISLGELAARQPARVIRVSATETPSTRHGQRSAGVRGRDRSGHRRGHGGAPRQLRRRRPHHQPGDRRGQIHGGVAQGIGQALYEQVVYDAQSGQLLTGSLMDYAAPRATRCRGCTPSSTKAFRPRPTCSA